MKVLIFCLALLLNTLFVFSQTSHTIEISRNDHSIIESNYSNTKCTLQSSEYLSKETDYTIIEDDKKYVLVYGKGNLKDNKGTRAKHKNYLISSFGDTLITFLPKTDELLIGDSKISIAKNSQGWHYIDNNNKKLFSVELSWNNEKWIYNLTSTDVSKTTKALHKAALISLVDNAKKLSAENDNSNDLLTNPWFILYLSSLNKK